MKTEELKIEGMSCDHCVMAVKNALVSLGVQNLEVEVGKAKFDYDENSIDISKIISVIEEEGYKVANVQ
ncbi:MAG: cation transporter [Bacteroidetes bacterium]|nr:cation transporter [Bacteroidota bacterium]